MNRIDKIYTSSLFLINMTERILILHTTWFGTFLVEEGDIVDKELFPKDAEVIAEKKERKEKGEILEEEKLLSERHDEDFYVTEERLSVLGPVKKDHRVDIKPQEHSFSEDLLHQALRLLGKRKIKESIDFGEHLARAVDTIQDLNETINIKTERLKTWYSLYFSELEKHVNDGEFIDLIVKHGDREEIKEEIGLVDDITGKEVTESEMEHFQNLAGSIKDERLLRKELEDYVTEKMEEYAPNITALAGPKLGGELIAAQGSLEGLAKQPSSTIQVLGAEKSLFKHLDKGTPPPKHGLILQHPFVHKAPKSIRGKIARAFANKIAIASRIDYFGGEFRGDEMRKDLEEKIEKIKKES